MPVIDVEQPAVGQTKAESRNSKADRSPRANLRLPLSALRFQGAASTGWLGNGLAAVKSRLGTKELRRRLWHMTPGLLPILLWPIPHADPISATLQTIIIAIVAVLAATVYLQYGRIARRRDTERVTCVVGYAGAVAAALLLFPSAAEIAFAVLAILAFGDGSATIGGKAFAGRPLPWNSEKTWSGLFSFLLVGTPMAALLYWGEASHNPEFLGPEVSFATATIICGAAVVASAVVESIRSRIDDNIRVGVTALLAVPLMHWLVVGWH